MAWPKTSEDLDALIDQHGLADQHDAIHRLVRPCIRLRRKRVEQSALGPVDSRIGGWPHLPEGMEWPMWKGRPLTHMATIRLSEASAFDREGVLPKKGMLWFWYEIVEGWVGEQSPRRPLFFRVQFSPDEDEDAELRAMPAFGPSRYCGTDYRGLAPCAIVCETGLSVPDRSWIERSQADSHGLGNSWLHLRALRGSVMPSPDHHLLGFAKEVQWGGLESACEGVARELQPPIADDGSALLGPTGSVSHGQWRLLLQIDTDEEGHGYNFVDDGVIFFFVEDTLLRASCFDRCWAILESS